MEKICFIIYYDEERSLQECIYYIQNMQIPEGFEIDFVYIKDAESFEEIKKDAVQKNTAKYKVYLDQNVLIVNRFFLYEILSRFRKNPEIGMIGVWGNDQVEENNQGRLLLWSEDGIVEIGNVGRGWDEEAGSINEMLVATQYDADCQEYISIIPHQDSSWCVYDCRVDKGEEIEREYRYQLLRAEFFHDMESRRKIGVLLNDGRLSLQQQIQRAERQAFAKTIVGYYWEDYYCSARKWNKYLPANGRVALERDCNEEMNIVMSFNHQYVNFAKVMLQSLYENNGLVNICVHVLQCDLTSEDRNILRKHAEKHAQRVVFYDFDRALLPKEIRTTKEWSIEAYFRLFMTDILPTNVERILYLDVDVIVNKPIYDFYYMDMQDYEIVGCRDFSLVLKENFEDKRNELFADVLMDEGFVYINSGVMLVNIHKLRESNYIDVYRRIMRERQEELLAPDQDIINLVHWKNIGLVDEYRYDFFNACFKVSRQKR